MTTSQQRTTPLVIRSAVVAALGGLLFGFDTAVISGTTKNLQDIYSLDKFWLGFTVATALIGTIIGAMSAGRPADVYGRKKVLLTIGVLYTISALGSALVSNWALFMFFRFIGGIGVGGASVVAPIYTAEISPARVRGRLVGLVQFNVVVGILVAYMTNYVCSTTLDYGVAWRWMLGVEAAPAIVFFLLALGIPESPRWLYGRGETDEARSIIDRLTRSREEADFEVNEIRNQLEEEASLGHAPFFVPRNYKVILLAFAIAAFNQLSGINAIMYYAPDIFRMAGAKGDAAFLSSIAIGAMNLVATMTALTVIDRFGRRRLMLVGSVGYLVSLGAISSVFFIAGDNLDGTTSTLVLVSLLMFIAAHAFGQGSVIWVFISEIFPSRIRARGQALGSFTHWFFAAIVTWCFPAVLDGLGGGWAFGIFFVCMIGQLVWVLSKMPETKGVPLEEMEKRLGID